MNFENNWGVCFTQAKVPYRRVVGSDEYTCRNVDEWSEQYAAALKNKAFKELNAIAISDVIFGKNQIRINLKVIERIEL